MNVVRGSMTLLPPAPHLCQECAVDHEADHPHNAQSLYYQMKFKMEHGREATWWDAMSHCEPETQRLWMEGLRRHGVPDRLLAPPTPEVSTAVSAHPPVRGKC